MICIFVGVLGSTQR